MDCERVRALLGRMPDGELAAEEVDLLEQHVAGCPSCGAETEETLRQERALWEMSGEAQAKDLAARIHAALPGRRALASKRRSAWPFLAAAAALAAVGLVAYFALREDPIGEVARVRGTVLPGAGKVYSGGWLETVGAGSGATIRFDDGTTAEVNGGTKLSRIEKGRLALEAGTLTVETGRPMTVTTPQAEARVLGTVFKVSVANQATRLEVKKGQVRITKLEDRASETVGADQFAVAARGRALEVRSTAPAPVIPPGTALIAGMAPGSWGAAPNTRMADVCPRRDQFRGTWGTMGPAAVVLAWSGGALDTTRNRLVLWGGGFSDYHGNDLYAFSLDSLKWERLTDPTPGPALGRQVNGDGTPNGRATYNGLAYLTQADSFFACGGVIAGGNGFGADLTWVYDFGKRRWENRAPSGDRPPTTGANHCAYDRATRKVWWGDSNGLYSYDVDANRWSRHTDDQFEAVTSAIDTLRGRFVVVGKGKVFVYDVRTGSPVRQEWATPGGAALVAKEAPGLDYDPVADRIVGWAGRAVYSLDPETKAWTAHDAPGAPEPTSNGMYGRWRYAPALGVFVAVTSIDKDVHFYKPLR